MANWLRLRKILADSEPELIPENVGTKIEDHLAHLNQMIEELKNENAETAAISERQQFQFEKEVFESQNQLKENVEASIELKIKLSEFEKNVDSLQQELRDLRQTSDSSQLDLQSLKRGKELLLQEKKQFVEQLERRKNEVEKLDGELKNLLQQATEANETKHAALARTEEAQMRESSLKHQVTRLEQEKSLLEKQIKDLNVEMAQKNHEVHVLKREKSAIVMELQTQLESRTDEVSMLDKQVLMLKQTNNEKDKRVDALAEKIRSLNESSRQMEEQYNLELGAQTKLVELYKKGSDDNEARVKELVSAFEQAQKLLQELSQDKIQAEVKCEGVESEHKLKIQTMEKELSKLKEELKHANDLCQGKVFSPETLESLFPTAAATSKVVHSGMTLTQIYSEYVKAQEQILELQNENARLNDQLKSIITEIEENTPVINQKMKEYHKALETVSCLRTQLGSSLTDYEKLQSERNDAKRITGQLERENKRLMKQVLDLNHQVQALLKEIEERRGNVVKLGMSGDQNVSSSDEGTADKVISRHLVTFRDIMELQDKNQKLLAVVRQLSEDQEQQEKQRTDEKNAEIQKELQSALSQLEDLQKNRVKQTELVESIIRQRDMYRVLLTHHGFSESLLGSPTGTPPSGLRKVTTSPGFDTNARSALQQLQSEFNNYKKEKAKNEKMLMDQLEKTRNDTADLRIDQAKLSSQLEYSKERIGILNSNTENYKKETMLLREKNQKHSTLMTQHQQTMQNLQQELMDVHEKLSKATVTLENVKSERDMLKNIEKRLLHEKESLFREQRQQSQVLANLQAVQNNLERIESESKRNMQYQVDKYEKENTMLKAKLESAHEDYKAAVAIWEKQNRERQQKIDAEIEKNDKLREDLVDAYSKCHMMQQKLNAAKSVPSSPDGKKETPASPGAASRTIPHTVVEVKKLKDQLLEVQAKAKALQEQLELSRKSCDHYMKMSNESELHIKELNEINQQLKTSIETTLKSSEEGRKGLEQSLERVEKANRDLIEENMKLSLSREDKIQELLTEVNNFKRQVLADKEAHEEAKKTASQAREDCLSQKVIMEETQEKYERELLLHAEDVRTLTTLKEEHQKCTDAITDLSKACRDSDAALREHKSSWAEQEKLLRAEQESVNNRVKDLSDQNASLLHQLELMGTQMKALQNRDWSDLPSEMPPVDLKDTNHLIEIIQYIKKEKEIIATQFDSTQSENIRLKLKVEQLTNNCNESKEELKDLMDSKEIKAATEAQHTELLRKVEMLNLLTESNSLLRSEKDGLLREKRALEDKLADLEKQMQPLSNTNKDVTSQLEILSTENTALRQEVKSWQSRTNQLLEQSHRIGPQEYKNLTRELDELKSQKLRLTEELQKKQSESSQLSSNIFAVKKEQETLRGAIIEKQREVAKVNIENANLQKTMLQVKKIGRKYKTQYDELKVAYDELTAKDSDAARQDLNVQEMRKKIQDFENLIKKLNDDAEMIKEALAAKAKAEVEAFQKQALEKEEKVRKLLAQAKLRINQINSQKNNMGKELENVKSELNSTKNLSGEETSRVAALKSLYDSRIGAIEAELKSAREESDSFKKQCDDLIQKMARQQKQVPKPATVVGIERGSSSSEVLTAILKPLSTPTQASGSGLRHAPHAASQSLRSTPTASIRPMAIATSGPPQARMVAVLPTTAVPSTSDEDLVVPSVTPLLTGTVPQAAIQPTPATATVAPTTVAPTMSPLLHALVMSDVAHASASVDAPTGQVVIEPVQNIHITATAFPTAHATAMVSPRVENLDVPDTAVLETPAPTTSVIVSPPATQTQLVPPTKRKNEDGPGSSGDGDMGSALKRVRMISEGSQTNQQNTVPSAHSINVAVVPVATVVSRTKVEIPMSEVPPSIHIESVDVPLAAAAPSTSTSMPDLHSEVKPMESDKSDNVADDKTIVPIEEKDDETIDWEPNEPRSDEDFVIVDMEEDETGESNEFEDDSEQDPSFPSQVVDEVISIDAGEDVDDMVEQSSEVPNEVDMTDGNSDSPMGSDSSNQVAPPGDQCMAPPASPMTQPAEATDTMSDLVIGQARRPAQIRRFPGSRQERLHSVGRQHLAVTIQGQSSTFEEGDDSIVPSTPTLYVPRQSDGFAEAINSPHVPSVRFLFSNPDSSPAQQGLSQLASQGALGVDDTRMDLSQFDEGSGRTVPSTPVQVSPPSEVSIREVPEISELSEQSVEVEIPIIIVENVDSDIPEKVEAIQASSTGADEVVSATLSVRSDEKSASDEGQNVTLAISSVIGSSSQETILTDSESSNQSAQPSQSVRKPIVWKEEKPAATTPTVTATTPAPVSVSLAAPPPTQFSPPPTATEQPTRGIRGRRMRYRGDTTYPRTLGSWPARRVRGRRGRMF